jgi:hypothetical protein
MAGWMCGDADGHFGRMLKKAALFVRCCSEFLVASSTFHFAETRKLKFPREIRFTDIESAAGGPVQEADSGKDRYSRGIPQYSGCGKLPARTTRN